MKWSIEYLKNGKVSKATINALTLEEAIETGLKKGKLVHRPKLKQVRKVTNNPEK